MNWWKLRRHVHASRLIALFCVGVSAGVILVLYLDAKMFTSVIWLIVAVALATIGFWRRRVYAICFIMVAGVLLGLWRGAIVQADLSPYKNFQEKQVMLVGRVSEDPELSSKHTTILRVDVQSVNNHPLPGMAWVTTNAKEAIKRGDIVTIEGTAHAGFGGFAVSLYRADLVKVFRPVPGDVAARIREWFSHQVHAIIPSPEATLGVGFLTGQRQSLPPELDEALRTAGLTHIVVASGYNLTILVRLTRRIFARISKYLAALSGGAMITGFMAITGMSPSMSRAGLVAGVSLLAWYYGRKFHPLVLLAFAMAVTLIVNPTYGWNDLGWQLSFAAFGGVMIVAPLLQAYFFGNKQPGVLRQVVSETIAAQLVTLPILVGAFGQFSNVALLANILVVPLVPLAMLFVFITGITASWLPWVAVASGWFAQTILGYMVGVVSFFADLPWAITEISLPVWVCVVAYGVIIGSVVYLWKATKYDLRRANLVD